MSNDPHDGLTELESAEHYLKEAQQLRGHNDDAALEMVDNALDEIRAFVDKEMARIDE